MIQRSVLMPTWLTPLLTKFASTGHYLLQGYAAETLWSEPALGAAYSAKQANKKTPRTLRYAAPSDFCFSLVLYQHMNIYKSTLI